MNLKLTAILVAMFLSAMVYAQDPPKAGSATAIAGGDALSGDNLTAKDYEELLIKLKGGDTGIDFRKMRLAYTETKDFAPYSGREDSKTVNEALDNKQYKQALEAAEARLKINYVDIDAHFGAFVANRELGNSEATEFHRLVVLGLLNSILDKADGKTPKTAYFVISTREEYFVMNFKGYRVVSQSLSREDGHIFDVLSGTNPETNETVKLYFNIDKVFGKF